MGSNISQKQLEVLEMLIRIQNECKEQISCRTCKHDYEGCCTLNEPYTWNITKVQAG